MTDDHASAATTASSNVKLLTPEQLTEDLCSARIGTSFRVHGTPHGFAVTLTTVQSYPSGGRPDRFRKPFSLLFLGPRTPILIQATHLLEADGLPPWRLFLTPILGADPATEGQLYQAVFG